MNLIDAATELGWKNFRLKQARHAREITLTENWDAITTLSKSDRAFLYEHVPFDEVAVVKHEMAKDGSAVKFLLESADKKRFEMVLLLHRGEKKNWGTVCVSSQIGCPVGCRFCATGQMQLTRNLTTEEILDQFIIAKREAKKRGITGHLNIVFMGMGEPLLNFDAVTEAIRVLTHPDRHALAPSRITLSTSGIVPAMQKLRDAKLGIGLALSLHAPTDTLRTKLMPINAKYPLADVLAETKKWEALGTEVLYEYVLIDGVNDSPAEARRLVELLKGRHAKLNLIPLNPVTGADDLRRPSGNRMHAFLNIVTDGGIAATLRHTKGDEIKAACGQLRVTVEKNF